MVNRGLLVFASPNLVVAFPFPDKVGIVSGEDLQQLLVVAVHFYGRAATRVMLGRMDWFTSEPLKASSIAISQHSPIFL